MNKKLNPLRYELWSPIHYLVHNDVWDSVCDSVHNATYSYIYLWGSICDPIRNIIIDNTRVNCLPIKKK